MSVSSLPSPSWITETCCQARPSVERSRIDLPCACQYAGTYQIAPPSFDLGRQKSQPAGSIGSKGVHCTASSLVATTVPSGVAIFPELGSA